RERPRQGPRRPLRGVERPRQRRRDEPHPHARVQHRREAALRGRRVGEGRRGVRLREGALRVLERSGRVLGRPREPRRRRGQPPVYTATARPKTCGEWRTAVEHGRQYITSTPITGEVITVASLVNLATYLGYPIPTDVASANAALAAVSQQRYGWPPAPYRN